MRGITVKIAVKTQTGTDQLGKPVYSDAWEEVEDVLVGEPSSDDINDAMTAYGKRATYRLAIPKGDSHEWDDTRVMLPAPFAGIYQTIGYATAGIEVNIPLRWNRKVLLEKVNA